MTLELWRVPGTDGWALVGHHPCGKLHVVVGPRHSPRYLWRWAVLEFPDSTVTVPVDMQDDHQRWSAEMWGRR